VIVCPDRTTNWQVLNQVVVSGNLFSQFSQTAKLRIYSTPDMIDLFEIRVDELSILSRTLIIAQQQRCN